MRLIPFVFILLLITFPFPVSGQSLTSPQPPETLIGNLDSVEISPSNFDAAINFTWPRSPQDDGTLQYNLYTLPQDPNGPSLTVAFNVGTPIPGRSNEWLYYLHTIAANDNGEYQFNITANNTGADESDYSCDLEFNFRTFNEGIEPSLRQCGEPPETPKGLSAFVTTRTVPGTVGNISIEIAESANDNDTNWTYILQGAPDSFLQYTEEGNIITNTSRIFREFDTDARSFNRTGTGFRSGIVQPNGLGLSVAFFRVIAYDNLTRWQSLTSCEIGIDIGKTQASAYCGEITDPSTDFPSVDGGVVGPQFPLVNLTSLSESVNASEELVALGLGFGIVATGAIVGIFIGIIPAFLLAIIGLALATALNLLPPWWLVVAFMGGLSMVIFRGGKTE